MKLSLPSSSPPASLSLFSSPSSLFTFSFSSLAHSLSFSSLACSLSSSSLARSLAFSFSSSAYSISYSFSFPIPFLLLFTTSCETHTVSGFSEPPHGTRLDTRLPVQGLAILAFPPGHVIGPIRSFSRPTLRGWNRSDGLRLTLRNLP